MPDTANDGIERSGARKPRVHIKYTVATKGAIKKKEIPFIIGVMADLSGKPKKSLPPVGEREFKNLDTDNFDKFLAAQRPRASFKVRNRLGKDGGESDELPVDIEFEGMEGFEAPNVAKKVPVINELLEARGLLEQLLTEVQGKEKLEQRLKELLHNPALMESLDGLLKEMKEKEAKEQR